MTDWGDLGPKDQARVTGLFQLIDFDKDGIISYQEIRNASGGDPDGTMQKMFKKMDTNKDDQTSEAEWITFWVKIHKSKGQKAFSKFIKSILNAAVANNPPAPDEVAGQSAELSGEVIGLASELYGLLDLNADGTISKEEFVNACGDMGAWNAFDTDRDDNVSLAEMLGMLGTMKTKKGQDCVVYFIKHLCSTIRANQAENPKARASVIQGKCTGRFHNRVERASDIENKIRGKNAGIMTALEGKSAGEALAGDQGLIKEIGAELLLMACYRGDCSAVMELSNSLVCPNSADGSGFTAVMYSILAGQTDAMKALYGQDVDQVLDLSISDDTGTTAMHVAACEGNMQAGGALMAWLSDKDAERKKLVSMTDNDGNTALHLASEGGHATFVAFLLSPQYGMAVSAKNKAGKDACALAQANGHTQIAVMLEEAAAK